MTRHDFSFMLTLAVAAIAIIFVVLFTACGSDTGRIGEQPAMMGECEVDSDCPTGELCDTSINMCFQAIDEMPTATAIPEPTQLPPVPTVTPPPDGLNEFQSLMLNLVNDARTESRFCGADFRMAVSEVDWDFRLEQATILHSEDMADNINDISHTGSNGSNFVQRIQAQGYNIRSGGENIAVGTANPVTIVGLWLDSPPHCSNLMAPSHEDVGVGIAEGLYIVDNRITTFWTMNLGRE